MTIYLLIGPKAVSAPRLLGFLTNSTTAVTGRLTGGIQADRSSFEV